MLCLTEAGPYPILQWQPSIHNYVQLKKYTFQSFLCFVDRASLYNLANKTNLVQNFTWYIYFFSLHVSGNYVPIIRRNNCIYATLGMCHSHRQTSHLYKVTSTKCRIDTVISPDYGHIAARNMYRKEINILRKIVHKVGFIYKTFQSARSYTIKSQTIIR